MMRFSGLMRGVMGIGAGMSLAAAVMLSAGSRISCAEVAARSETHAAHADAKTVALIDLEHAPLEQPPAMAWLFGPAKTPTTRELLAKLHELAKDPEIAAVVLRLRDVAMPTSQTEELGKGFEALKAAGKKVYIFADGYELSQLYLGSYADQIILQQGGAVSLPGMHMEQMYLGDTLSWVGVTPQLIQIGDYKGANETMMRAAPSPQWEENISGLLDSLYANVRERIKTGRKMDDAKLDGAMNEAWLASGETGVKVGLVDALVDLPKLTDHLKTALSTDTIDWTNVFEDREHAGMDISNPLGLLAKLSREPDLSAKRDSIAVLHIDGPIVDGDSSDGGFMSEASVGSHTIRRAIEAIGDDDLVKGVVVRIDSPGGSAIASEVIWQGVQRLREKKPVWISIGSMAASGGYYVAVSGEKIYVNPSSIVGSIGVVGGKMALGGLYDKAKIHVIERSRGPMGSILSSARPWSDAEQTLVRGKMKETYDLFTKRVSGGRTGIELNKTAEGRLFTGRDAIKNKMADKLGGLDDALTDLASKLNLAADGYDVIDYPGPKSLQETIEGYFGASASAPGVAKGPSGIAPSALGLAMDALKEVVGEKSWPSVRANLRALMEMRKEPVLLTAPEVVIVR